MTTPCFVSLAEYTSFLVTDDFWINIDEIVAVSLYDGTTKDEVHIKTTQEVFIFEGESAEELRVFLKSKEQEYPWREN